MICKAPKSERTEAGRVEHYNYEQTGKNIMIDRNGEIIS